MRIATLLTFLIILAAPGTTRAGAPTDTAAPGGKLHWQSFNDGFAAARQNGRKIIVDVYTDWCGWCKKLDKDVYGDPKVAAYLRDHFVLVKLNPEIKANVSYRDTVYSAAVFAQGFGVSGYPTILFFEPSGEPIDRLGGYVGADKFLPIIKFIGEDYFKKMKWEDFMKTEGDPAHQ
ncbi:MAG TPA: thioredoxin fold domain-containing protein [Bacteroidota bacterium]|nr:thioredoxin fold domain-containing protein [Bacteroidota bacterium]